MTAEEIRLRLHAFIDELPEEALVALQQEIEEKVNSQQRRQLIAKIVAENAPLLKRLGR